MNKEEIISMMAKETRQSKKDSEAAFNAMIKIISNSLRDGERVNIVGFGVFEVKNRAPRMGRNPKANKPVPIPARKVPYFTPGKVLKELVENI